jgi:hypothetical protein
MVFFSANGGRKRRFGIADVSSLYGEFFASFRCRFLYLVGWQVPAGDEAERHDFVNLVFLISLLY